MYWPLVAVVAFDRREASTGARLSAEIAYLRTRRGVVKILAIGVCNSLNGLLQVYASSTTRVPGALQPILLQSTLLFTVVGSKLFLRKAYSKGQLGGQSVPASEAPLGARRALLRHLLAPRVHRGDTSGPTAARTA